MRGFVPGIGPVALLEAVGKAGYDAGVVTSVPYAIAGVYLCHATVSAWRALGRNVRADRAPLRTSASLSRP